MKLVIDYREKRFIEILKKTIDNKKITNFSYEIKNLPIGDIIFFNEEKKTMIIERKTLNDLSASIKDGRYKEQSFRLNECSVPNHNIIFLVEGSEHFYTENKNLPFKTLQSAMFSLYFFNGFSIFKTDSVQKSVDFIINCYEKIKNKNLVPYYLLKDHKKNDYIDNCKKNKKKNIILKNMGEIMLAQIPGISSAISKLIIEKYKTISNLCKIIQTEPNVLYDLKIKTKTGKERKISKTAVFNIINYL